MKRKIFMLCVLVATMGALAVLIAGLILNHIYLRNAGAIAISVCFIVFAAGNFVFLVKKAKHVYSEHEEKGKESLDDDLKDDINSTNEKLESYGSRILIDMVRAYRRSSLVEKIKGIVYITFILGGMLAFAVVLTLGYYTWALITWGIVAFTLIMTMAIVKIAECRVLSYRNYKNYMKNEKYYIKNTAVVKFCSI